MGRYNYGGLTAKALLVLVSSCVGVLLMELVLRVFYPISLVNVERPNNNVDGIGSADEHIVPDESLGIRPKLGTSYRDHMGVSVLGSIYSGAPHARRIFFIGDSVTQFGLISRALAMLIGSDNTSFLNGGSASYNIPQEVEFFLRYQKDSKPDVIVHQMHVNDLALFSGMVRVREGGDAKHYSPHMKPAVVNRTLYRYSHVYRLYLLFFMARVSKDILESQTLESLRIMRDYAREHGISYYVYLFPILRPLASWSARDRDSYDFLLKVSDELGLEVVDLQPVAENLMADGVDIQMRPGDTWHPNQRMADEAARYILLRIPALAPSPEK